MSITVEKKQDLIKDFALGKADTGSVDVQCAILTERVKNLTAHLSFNKKDTQAKRGLIFLVNQRRKLLRYLERKDAQRYKDLIKKLGIRK
ncbi:MAG: rpsO [Candidatus Midichloriaceae bacterium]|jgi:small subunit ribosomal protein S15|nr:30S ribosomal protein S15 [Candidatus Jidaibacter sp.]MDF3047145.1 rpsO [Candidatus Midichloriaceae bacterium]